MTSRPADALVQIAADTVTPWHRSRRARAHGIGVGQAARRACDTTTMKEDRVAQVTLAGDITGDYLVDERLQDGRLVLRPDTRAPAIIERTGGGQRLTPEELEEHFGQLPTDDEG